MIFSHITLPEKRWCFSKLRFEPDCLAKINAKDEKYCVDSNFLQRQNSKRNTVAKMVRFSQKFNQSEPRHFVKICS